MKFTRANVISYIGIVIGSVIIALALNWFLVPNALAAGGASGIAIILNNLFGIPVGLIIFMINVPLFFWGVKVFGRGFGLKTVFGAVVLSVAVDLLAPYLTPLTEDAVLASVYGGVMAGLGMGITFKAGGTTGGTDIAARIIGQLTGFTTGQALLGIDFLVITSAGLVFGPEVAMYALLALFLLSKVIDIVQEGGGYAKACFIISKKTEKIAGAILNQMDRGVTYLSGRGGYTNSDLDILLCVVSRGEVTRLKQIVHSFDEKAFVIIADIREVLGEGFRKISS